MTYLIDSDFVIDVLADDLTTRQLMERLATAGITISMVTFMEVTEGILRESDSARMQAAFDVFLEGVPILPFDEDSARRCAALRDSLRRRGKRVRQRALDLITAATALEHGLTLVTRNKTDYEDIPGLNLLP